MKVILILLLFAYELSYSNHIHNIQMNTEYTVDLSEYPDYEIPSKTNQYFRISLEGNEGIEIQLKTFHGSTPSAYFKIDLCPFSKLPSNDEVIALNKNCFIDVPCSGVSKHEIYDVYKYHIEKINGLKYLSMHIENLYVLDYLSIYCYQPSKADYKIYDISYMEEYKLNTTSLNDKDNVLLFRMENTGIFDSIKIKVSKELKSEIKMNIGGYRDKPIMTDDFENYIDAYNPEVKSVTQDEKYSYYEFPYKKIDDTGYIVMLVYLQEKVEYFSIYVGP